MSAKKLPATLEETGEIHRDKCRQVIYRALADEVPAPDEPESPTSPTKLGSKACAIEEEIFHLHGDRPEAPYKDAVRSHVFNLRDKRNPELKKQVVEGDIPPEKFAAMTSEEMATPERKAEVEFLRRQSASEACLPPAEGSSAASENLEKSEQDWNSGVHDPNQDNARFAQSGVLEPRRDDRTGRGHISVEQLVSGGDDDAQNSLL